jgi:hypothetical protein
MMKNRRIPKAVLLLAAGFALGTGAHFFFPAGESVAPMDTFSGSVASQAEPTPRPIPQASIFNPVKASVESAVHEQENPPAQSRGPSPVADSPISAGQYRRQTPQPGRPASGAEISPSRPSPTAPSAISSPDANGQVIPIPARTRLPAVLIDLGQATDQQASVADEIAAAYLDRGAVANPSGRPNPASVANPGTRPEASEAPEWDAAREASDEHYRAIFGQDAYVRNSLEAARQALDAR